MRSFINYLIEHPDLLPQCTYRETDSFFRINKNTIELYKAFSEGLYFEIKTEFGAPKKIFIPWHQIVKLDF